MTPWEALKRKGKSGYLIRRDSLGIVHCETSLGRELKPIPVHSPTGFEYGYGGSGPAELALCILAHYLGRDRADGYYQRFKWDFIAKVKGHHYIRSFIITTDEIDTWLEGVKAERAEEEGK